MKVNNCKVRKAKNGKINQVLDFSGNESKLFKEILNIPVLSMNEALEVYKGIYGEKLRDKVKFQKQENNYDKARINEFQTSEFTTDEQSRDRTRWNESRGNQTLKGAPTYKNATGATPELVYLAEEYAQEIGIEYKRQSEYVEVVQERSERIADAYENMKHAPENSIVKEAYQNLINQTVAQYNKLIDSGYQFYFFDENNDPYDGKPVRAMVELRTKKTMGVFATNSGFGSGATDINVSDNPMLQDTGLEWGYGSFEGRKIKVLANDLFRAVHDAFGHGLEGAGFRERGEENAWQAHSRLFTGSALAAITSETRGQNSWLNFNKNLYKNVAGEERAKEVYPEVWDIITIGEHNKTAKVEDTIFADQKVGLMPEWTWKEGFDEGIKFQIIGEKGAQNLDNFEEATFRMDNLLIAQEMQKADKTPLEIRLATGWEMNLADKKWRYEILDGNVKPIKLNAVVTLPTFENKLTEIKLSDLYVNKELYNTYPKLKESKVYVYESNIFLYDNNRMFTLEGNIYINKKTYETRDTTLYYSESEGHPLQHEIQHLLQNIEGFAKGTSPIWSRKKIDESIKSLRSNFDSNKRRSGIEGELDEYTLRLLQKNLPENFVDAILRGDDTFLENVSVLLGRELYKNFAGEVEARNVESRVGMSAKERLNNLLSETQEIPFEDQFVLQMKSGIQSLAKTAPQITEELIDKLKQNGLANDVFQLSSQEIDDKLKEIGEQNVVKTVNGFTYKNDVYLNKDSATDETLLHEYNHLFLNWAKIERPEIYSKGLNLIEQELEKENLEIQDIIDFVKQNQPNLKGEVFKEELLTEFIGRYSKQMMDNQKSKSPLMQWLSDFWDSIKKILNILDATPEQVANMSLKEFAESSVYSLLLGENIGTFLNNSNNTNYQIIGEKGIKNTQDAINRLDNLKVAQEMEQADKTPKEIRLATGWEKGADGLFRYEIADGTFNDIENIDYNTDVEGLGKVFVTTIGKVYNSEELFQAYPQLKDTRVIIFNSDNNSDLNNYSMFVANNFIYINTQLQDDKSKISLTDLTERGATFIHELQHLCQEIEGFDTGGDANEYAKRVTQYFDKVRETNKRDADADIRFTEIASALQKEVETNPYIQGEKTVEAVAKNKELSDLIAVFVGVGIYQKKAGEIEAKNAETRLNFSPQERLNTLLSETQEISFEDQYVFRNDINTQASQKAIEPSLTIETPNGEIFTSYQQALQATNVGKIKIKIDNVLLTEVDSNTDIRTFQGTINHLVKHGGLSGERVLDTNGDIIYITQGETNTAKYLTSELVEKQAIKLLGVNNVKYLKTGDFVLVDNLNKTTINREVVNNEDLDNMSFENLSDKFGEEKALEIEFQREYIKMLQPTTNKKLLEAQVEFKSDDDLVRSIKSLLNSLGIKITSIEDYIKNNTIKNNGVAPQANALMDLVNKVMAFKNGKVTREDLIEETMHLIEATIDPKTTEGLRRNISKTAEWKQYSEEYFNIYSKEYTGEKLDEMVRREILGKVMANAIINNFAQSENATLTEQSIFSKIREILENFFNTINNYFKPEYQTQIDNLNNDIYAKLMAGTLANDLNLEQNYGTKFRLYSLSNNLSNDVVRLQKEAEKALQILRRNTQQIASDDPSLSQQIKAATQMLKQSVEKGNGIEAQIELIATFSKVMNMVQKQTKYLERVAKKAVANKRPFSSEEMIVYNSLKQDFNNNILPVIEGHLKTIGNKNPAEIRLEQAYNKTIKEINGLLSDIKNNGFEPKGYIVDLMVKRLSLNKEQEAFMRERVEGQQQETNWFFMNFGSLSHASNTYLNVLGAIVTKTDGDKREGFQQDTKPFLEKLNELKRLGTSFKDLIKGDFLQSSLDFNEIEKQTAIQKYESFFKIVDKQLLTETKDTVITNLNKIKATKVDSTDPLYSKAVKEFDDEQIKVLEGIYYSDFKTELEDWQKEEYRMSPMKLEFTRKRREALKLYDSETQSFERNYSATYSDIMSKAEVVDKIPLISHEMREAITNLRRLRSVEKELYNREGVFKTGLANAKEGDDGAIQIADDKYIKLLSNPSPDARLALQLNQIDYKKLEDNKNKNKDKDGLGMTKKFRDMFSKLDDDQAYDFLMLNSFVGYTEEYYNETKIPSIISKLEKAKNEENEEAIQELIEEILANTTQMSNILKANKVMNNPAEVSYDDMETDETKNIKDYSENLERYYAEARQYLSKEEAKQEDRIASENIPNKAFSKYLVDAENIKGTVRLDYKDSKKLEKDDLINIDKIFEAILQHVTNSKSKNIRNYRGIPTQETISKFTVAQKRIFSLTEEQYNEMDKDERAAMMTNELLQFSYTQLLPYFRKSTPTGLDAVLLELESGTITPQAFLAEYERTDSERDERYKYLSITPNYNFQDSADNENKNVHFDNTRLNNSPFVRIFEDDATIDNIKGKSAQQLKTEGKLSKYADIEFLERYGIDLPTLFTTGVETATKDLKNFDARQTLIDLQKKSVEKNGMSGKHNIYLLPQKEASLTKKADRFIKDGKLKNIKDIVREAFNFREDDIELGENNDSTNTQLSDGNHSIPKYGFRRLKEAPVTDDLLESYMWMNYKANEHLARKINIGDVLSLEEALVDATFEGNISATTSKVYKMFKENKDFNYYGIKETWSSTFKIGNMTFDWAKIVKNFGFIIRLRNLGFALISPITSFTTGLVNFDIIERIVGDTVDKDAINKASTYFKNNANAAMREIMGFQGKSKINSLGEFWGWYDPIERFENTDYGKVVRGIPATAFAAHSMANFPVNPRVGLAILANNKFVEGELMEYMDYKLANKDKTEKENREKWTKYTSVLEVMRVDEKDGLVSYEYDKIAKALNNNFTEAEAKEFIEAQAILIRGRIKAGIQKVDGAISTEDKSMSSRNAFGSFLNIHRSWLMIAVQNKFKSKQFNYTTKRMEEGSYNTFFKQIIFDKIIGESRKVGVLKAIKKLREEYKDYDDYTKKNVKRTVTEMSVLTTLIALTLMGLKELDDDDEDSYAFKVGALFLFRTTNEVASGTTALPLNIYETTDNLVVGLNTVEILTDLPSAIKNDMIERGRYAGLTERQRYFFKHIPGIRDYNNLFRDVEGTINSYNYFNFKQNNTLQMNPAYFLLDEIINDEGEE